MVFVVGAGLMRGHGDGEGSLGSSSRGATYVRLRPNLHLGLTSAATEAEAPARIACAEKAVASNAASAATSSEIALEAGPPRRLQDRDTAETEASHAAEDATGAAETEEGTNAEAPAGATQGLPAAIGASGPEVEAGVAVKAELLLRRESGGHHPRPRSPGRLRLNRPRRTAREKRMGADQGAMRRKCLQTILSRRVLKRAQPQIK